MSLAFIGKALAAGTTGGNPLQFPNPLGESTLIGVVQKLLSGLNTIAIPLVAIMVVIGGLQMVTAGGDPKKYEMGKQTIYYVVIGYAVILLAQGIVFIIKDILS